MLNCSLYRRVPLTYPNSISWAKQLVPLSNATESTLGWVVVVITGQRGDGGGGVLQQQQQQQQQTKTFDTTHYYATTIHQHEPHPTLVCLYTVKLGTNTDH